MTNRDELLGTIFLLRKDIENDTNLASICDGLAEAIPLLEGEWCPRGCIGSLERDEEQEILVCSKCLLTPSNSDDGSLGDAQEVVDIVLKYTESVWNVLTDNMSIDRDIEEDKANMAYHKGVLLEFMSKI